MVVSAVAVPAAIAIRPKPGAARALVTKRPALPGWSSGRQPPLPRWPSGGNRAWRGYRRRNNRR